MLKLPFVPDADGYAVTFDQDEVIAANLPGGRPRTRRNFINGSDDVSTAFSLDREGYDLFMAFYGMWVENPVPFLCNLIGRDHAVREHIAQFTPGSVKLANQRGLSYKVSAGIVSIAATGRDPNEDWLLRARVTLASIYGSEEAGKRVAMLPLWQIVNVIQPVNDNDRRF